MLSVNEIFKRRHFDREIIVLCVRRYLRHKLSFRYLAEMMAERGLSPPTRRSCVGSDAFLPRSRNAGTASPARLERALASYSAIDVLITGCSTWLRQQEAPRTYLPASDGFRRSRSCPRRDGHPMGRRRCACAPERAAPIVPRLSIGVQI